MAEHRLTVIDAACIDAKRQAGELIHRRGDLVPTHLNLESVTENAVGYERRSRLLFTPSTAISAAACRRSFLRKSSATPSATRSPPPISGSTSRGSVPPVENSPGSSR